MRTSRGITPALWLTLALAAAPATATDEPPQRVTTDDVIDRERARAATAAAFDAVRSGRGRAKFSDLAIDAARSLAPLGPDVVPFLAGEFEQELESSFYLCGYVLGWIDTPEAEQALREAVERSSRLSGERPMTHQAWAAWALALQGHDDAVDLTIAGGHNTSPYPIHQGTSAIEAIGLLTAPHSVPRLIAQVERFRAEEQPEQRHRAVWPLKALRRIADPTAVPTIVAALGDPDPVIRREAARSLETQSSPEGVAALVAALADTEAAVRRGAAAALNQIRPQNVLAAVAQRLEREDDGRTRGWLYRVAAHTGKPGLVLLNKHLGSPNPMDRVRLAQALALIRDDETVALLAGAFRDSKPKVQAAAAEALTSIGSDSARAALIDAVPGGSELLVQRAVDGLRLLEADAAAPVVLARLMGRELAGEPAGKRERRTVSILLRFLHERGYTEALPELRTALERQTYSPVVTDLGTAVARLEALDRNANKISRWTRTLDSDDDAIRAIAYRRIAEIGGKRAAVRLIEAFPRAAGADRIALVHALGSLDSAPTNALLERILTDPEFDATEQLPLRDAAAWSARRIGGPAMLRALMTGVERRQGQDARVMVYAGVLGGDEALPLLRTHGRSRLRLLGSMRGLEQEELDRLTRAIREGRSLSPWDRPPDQLSFRH